jgi:hypothetical protein
MAFDQAGAVAFAKTNRLGVKEDGLKKTQQKEGSGPELFVVKADEKIRGLTVAEGPTSAGHPLKSQILTIKNTGGTPVYYLPWNENAGYRITLSAENNVDPDLFVTAGLNGCSVFVEGDPKTPTVYHFNAKDTGGSLGDYHMPMDAAQFENTVKQKAMDMDNRFKICSGTQKAYKVADGKGRSVNPTHYMGPVAFKKEYDEWAKKVAAKFKCPKDPVKFTEGQSAGQTESPIQFVGWATVFGVKQKDATWKFFLQPRWCVTYMTLKKGEKGTKRGDYDFVTDWVDVQPATEFYPGTGGVAI